MILIDVKLKCDFFQLRTPNIERKKTYLDPSRKEKIRRIGIIGEIRKRWVTLLFSTRFFPDLQPAYARCGFVGLRI